MGAIEQAAKAAAPERRGFREALEDNWERIASVMPSHMSPERLFQMAVSAYNTTPKLNRCSTASVLSCVMKCSALGMEPSAVDGMGRAYIIPYYNRNTKGYEAQFMLGYKGMIELARRSGQILDISARVVREGDEFDFCFGLDETLRHVPSLEPTEGRPMTHVYMVAHFKDGSHYIDVMSKAEVDAVRARSRAASDGPWVTDYESMARKTVIRRAFPYLPVSIEVQADVASDGTVPRFVTTDGDELFALPGDHGPDGWPGEVEVAPEAVEATDGGEAGGDSQG